MNYFLLIAVAAILVFLLIATLYNGTSLCITYKNPDLQIICRLLFIIAQILLIVVACNNPAIFTKINVMVYDPSLILLNTALAIFVAMFLEALLFMTAFVIIAWCWDLIKKVAGWIFFGDPNHFFYGKEDD